MELNPEEYFIENYYNLDLQALEKLNKEIISEGLLRFVNGLNDFVYGVFVFDSKESEDLRTHLFYAEYNAEFSCIVLPIPIKNSKANEIVFVLAREINKLNPEKDIFTIFNTLQQNRESALEKLGFFTFNPFTFPKGTLITKGQEMIAVWKLERLEVYKSMFENIVDTSAKFKDIDNYVYLMVDNSNGLIKIGRSKNPKYREGTLQSKEPTVHMIAFWKAPKQIEKDLHYQFHSKRVRGEWFNLTIAELENIKDFMNSQ